MDSRKENDRDSGCHRALCIPGLQVGLAGLEVLPRVDSSCLGGNIAFHVDSMGSPALALLG